MPSGRDSFRRNRVAPLVIRCYHAAAGASMRPLFPTFPPPPRLFLLAVIRSRRKQHVSEL